MKKATALLLSILMALGATACGGGAQSTSEQQSAQNQPAQGTGAQGGTAADGYQLALITDLGTIDDKSFNQGAWEGLTQFAEESGMTHKYYQPSEQSDDAYLATIDLAVQGGAQLIVTPGFLFETPVYIAQDLYPEVCFVLLDGTPHSADYSDFRTNSNAVGILYAEEQAGFLAGYAAVRDGMTQLGFLGGMAVPAVVRFGHGYVQGADWAAREMGLAAGSLRINYHYTGGFEATPEAQAMAASWYNDGIEAIFGCGGAVGNSAMAAAEQAGKWMIGVDVDQSSESDSVITSATKGLRESVYSCVADWHDGSFPGGQTLVFEAENDGVSLPMATSRFESFGQAEYDSIYQKLVSGEIPLLKDSDADGNEIRVSDLPVEIVAVSEF